MANNCPNCGAPASGSRCEYCKTILDDSGLCWSCKAFIGEDTEICPKCGESQYDEEDDEEENGDDFDEEIEEDDEE